MPPLVARCRPLPSLAQQSGCLHDGNGSIAAALFAQGCGEEIKNLEKDRAVIAGTTESKSATTGMR